MIIISDFFLILLKFWKEKLAEAQRKFENLKSELKDSTSTQGNFSKDVLKRRNRSSLLEIEADDDDENSKKQTKQANDDTEVDESDASKVGLLRKRLFSKKIDSVADESNNGAQSLAQRLIEKNRQRQQKQKQVRKISDLKLAYSEFYLSLILLQNYQTLNFTGFRKILKKHDKIFKTDRGSDWHKLNVEAAPFNTTKKVDTLIAEVENLFTQYLENGDKTRAMKRLRVPPFEEKVK